MRDVNAQDTAKDRRDACGGFGRHGIGSAGCWPLIFCVKNLHFAALVGAAMCSACLRGTHDRGPYCPPRIRSRSTSHSRMPPTTVSNGSDNSPEPMTRVICSWQRSSRLSYQLTRLFQPKTTRQDPHVADIRERAVIMQALNPEIDHPVPRTWSAGGGASRICQGKVCGAYATADPADLD